MSQPAGSRQPSLGRNRRTRPIHPAAQSHRCHPSAPNPGQAATAAGMAPPQPGSRRPRCRGSIGFQILSATSRGMRSRSRHGCWACTGVQETSTQRRGPDYPEPEPSRTDTRPARSRGHHFGRHRAGCPARRGRDPAHRNHRPRWTKISTWSSARLCVCFGTEEATSARPNWQVLGQSCRPG